MGMLAEDLRNAMTPICRVTASRRHLPYLRKGLLYEITEDEDDLYAVADGNNWISMCIVPCEPANPAAVDLWLSMGWALKN